MDSSALNPLLSLPTHVYGIAANAVGAPGSHLYRHSFVCALLAGDLRACLGLGGHHLWNLGGVIALAGGLGWHGALSKARHAQSINRGSQVMEIHWGTDGHLQIQALGEISLWWHLLWGLAEVVGRSPQSLIHLSAKGTEISKVTVGGWHQGGLYNLLFLSFLKEKKAA